MRKKADRRRSLLDFRAFGPGGAFGGEKEPCPRKTKCYVAIRPEVKRVQWLGAGVRRGQINGGAPSDLVFFDEPESVTVSVKVRQCSSSRQHTVEVPMGKLALFLGGFLLLTILVGILGTIPPS